MSPGAPRQEGLCSGYALGLVATATQAPMVSDGATGNPRGLFGLDGAVGEGMSIGTVKVFVPDRGVPGGGIGYGYFNCGVTAPEGEFADAYRDVERVYDPANNEV